MQTQNQKDETKTMKMNSDMQACVKSCLECFEACTSLLNHCLEKGGKHADIKHINLLNDCAKICNLSADFMLRNSAYHSLVCGACAVICRSCVQSCEAIGDDEMMNNCADTCRQCATSCEKMSTAH